MEFIAGQRQGHEEPGRESDNDKDIDSLRRRLSTMIAQRELLEVEAEAIHSELTSVGVNGESPAGLNDPLVDAEGFPRGDIDIYNVRNKRRRLREINTDHRALMAQIEELLHKLHLMGGNTASSSEVVPTSDSVVVMTPTAGVNPTALAVLDEILEGSPAKMAGVHEKDELLCFGSIDASTPSPMQAIARLVSESVNREIIIRVRRSSDGGNRQELDLTLIPRPWGGRGLLGCHLGLASSTHQ